MLSLDSSLVLKESLPALLCKDTVEHDSVSFNDSDEQVNCLDFSHGLFGEDFFVIFSLMF